MRRLIALDLPGSQSFVDRVVEAWSSGDAVLPLDQRLPRAERERLVTELGAHEVVSPGEVTTLTTGRALEHDDALVIATSGSSGRSKGVVLTRTAIEASARASSSRLGIADDDHWLACLPLSHIGGFSVVSRALCTRTPLTVMAAADPDTIRADTDSTRIALVPTLLSRIDVSRFRTVLLGGSRPPARRPANVIATYGLTESGSGIVYDGWPLDTVEVRISADDEILVRGPMLMRGYRDGSTSIDERGWLHTGDTGSLDDEGRLSVTGRLDDLIKTGGEKVWPNVVERVLEELFPDHEACIVGAPDSDWGQIVVLVTDRPGLRLAEVRARMKERLPASHAPKRIVVADLPRTTNGKVQRSQLRRLAEERAFTDD